MPNLYLSHSCHDHDPPSTLSWESPPVSLRLVTDEVQVWRATIDPVLSLLPDLITMLTNDELERAEKFKFAEHRNRFIAARSILRMILGSLLAVPPRAIEFSRRPDGKPELAGHLSGSAIRFNTSHSGAVALYAFALHREVGIDVEILRSIEEVEQLAGRFLSPDEAATVRKEPEMNRGARFLRFWTYKEAYVKATGEGLTIPLDQIEVSQSAPAQNTLLQSLDASQDDRWTLFSLPHCEGYVGSAVVEGPECDLACFDWSS